MEDADTEMTDVSGDNNAGDDGVTGYEASSEDTSLLAVYDRGFFELQGGIKGVASTLRRNLQQKVAVFSSAKRVSYKAASLESPSATKKLAFGLLGPAGAGKSSLIDSLTDI